jgi:arabinan endo-1,5-alpha-L-arabinosidase
MKKVLFLFILFVLSLNVLAQSGLVAKYTFEGNLTNEAGSSFGGTLNGSPAYETNVERGNTVIHLNSGGSNYVTFPNPLQGSDNLSSATISLWVNNKNGGQYAQYFGAIWSFWGNPKGRFYLTPNTYLGYNNEDGMWFDGNHPDNISTTAIADNQWSMVTVTVNSSGFAIYINGEKKYDNNNCEWGASIGNDNRNFDFSLVLDLIKSSANFYLGYGSWWDDHIQLLIDDLSIYKGTLTDAEISALYNYSGTLTWTGAVDSNWNNPANWDKNIVPYINTKVILPSGLNNYPHLQSPAYCNIIHFGAGAELGNPQKLNYFKAEVDFDLLEKTRDGRYYTIGAPLKNMVVGDFSFGGSPTVYAKYATSVASTIGSNTDITELGFTEDLPDYDVELPGGFGFAYKVGTDLAGGNGYDQTLTFPSFVPRELDPEDASGETALEDFVPPSYVDNYGEVKWNNLDSWNLTNVHDPTVEKCGEYYYMYQTDASYGNVFNGHGHFFCRRSKDLVNWEFIGSTMETVPAWIKTALNDYRKDMNNLSAIANPVYAFWAPVVRKVADNKYRMYYSIVIDNYIKSGDPNTEANFDGSWTERAFIGLMETNDLASNNWTDMGMVVTSASDKGTDYNRSGYDAYYETAYFKWNAIDPTYIITPAPENKHYLIYGSWHSGIVSLELNPETGMPKTALGNPWGNNAAAIASYGSQIFTRVTNSRWQGSEGPEIIYHNGYYYLFLAYDELSVAYNTRVCRSTNINGPYLGYNGNNASGQGDNLLPILTHPYKFNDHSGWVGISHCAVFEDGAGNWFYASQGRLPANTGGDAYSNAIMMGHVRKIRWTSDGWPVVMPERYSAVPDVKIKEEELVGDWETINLSYSRGNQKTSASLTLGANGQATGSNTGAWSWNASTKILTVGSLQFCVERETDWEASPRKLTLVFAGLNGSGVSIWGKKK